MKNPNKLSVAVSEALLIVVVAALALAALTVIELVVPVPSTYPTLENRVKEAAKEGDRALFDEKGHALKYKVEESEVTHD